MRYSYEFKRNTIEEYINYYNKKRIQTKQNGCPCKFQGNIHVFGLGNNIYPRK
ncbi:IS3 family transposase [Veillonella tobetsuensis]|uniref:IS3 family transposase n=1 Tax=Veillonella tobetsuensis TaxID=1110546 RepID=UPI0012933B28